MTLHAHTHKSHAWCICTHLCGLVCIAHLSITECFILFGTCMNLHIISYFLLLEHVRMHNYTTIFCIVATDGSIIVKAGLVDWTMD